MLVCVWAGGGGGGERGGEGRERARVSVHNYVNFVCIIIVCSVLILPCTDKRG